MHGGPLGREYRDGEVICRQGDRGDSMYVVQHGRLIVLREEDGRAVVLRELTSGDIFGEMAIFEDQPRSATVKAQGNAQVLTLDRQAFLRAVHQDPSMAYRILQMMSHRIRTLTEEVARLRG
jgi:CRP/FNR family transcriptional regulator